MKVVARLKRKVFPIQLSRALEIVNQINTKGGKAPHWFNGPVRRLIEFLGDVTIAEVTEQNIRDWYQHARTRQHQRQSERKLSAWTVDSYGRALKSFFEHLVRAGHLETNPARGLRLPKLPKKGKKEISLEELERMVQHSAVSARDHAIVLILRDSGCRVGGLVSMMVSTVRMEKVVNDAEKKRWRGTAIVTEKMNKTRYIFFGHEACKALKQYLKVRPYDAPDYLWLSTKGVLTTSGVYQVLKRVAKRAGVKTYNPHAFRHACAKRLLNAGAPHPAIASILGHEDVTTFLTMYVDYDNEELQELHAQFNAFD